MHLQSFLSDFGNALVAGVAALIIFGWLCGRLGWVAAMVFAICLLGVIGSVVGLKFIAYGLRPPVDDASLFALSEGAPSGHTALATITYGSLAAILAVVDRRPVAWLAAAACAAIIAAVAITRVTLAMHTAGDVIAGFAVSAIGVGVFARALSVQTPTQPTRAVLLFSAVAVATLVLLAGGFRLNTLTLL